MDALLRAAVIDVALVVRFRIAGTQGLLGDDLSITDALLVIGTLLGLGIAMSLLRRRSRRLDRIVDGIPMVIVRDGVPDPGLERLDQIRHAVLERSGGTSIIPA